MASPLYLALGTNLGDREANLQAARDALAARVRLIRESSIYETPPWGYIDQPEFLNQVVEVDSVLKPLPLLHFLKEIEAEMGREATFRNGPRLIDLDILFYGQAIIDGQVLKVPHPRLQERAFVLVPLDQIAPDFVHPVLKKTVHGLLQGVNREGIKRL
ncbi:MAG: 2-amino-4-hydroxy-6-hydroxymethyldihydropteridine diphosphokinase [Chloroflexota bacterium]|nr:2-amino-4-hydroxy-6-hydroxymethyldihydropteridine diphosphokinase [Chloroflexota bacterium]